MRRLAFLAVLGLGLAACGGSGGSKQALKITFGAGGGSLRPFSVTIAPDGAVTRTGGEDGLPNKITTAEEAKLSRLVRARFPSLKSERCSGTFPDESASFITALGKTVTVRGTCERGFTEIWDALATAVVLYHH